MEIDYYNIFRYFIEIIVFLCLMVIITFIYKKLKKSRNKLLNINEYFPREEVHSLRQIFYLIMMGLFFTNVLYGLIFITNDQIYFVILDIILSLYLAINLDKSSFKNKILLILLIPYGALNFIIFGDTLVGLVDLIHIPIFIYFIKVYYDKFREYTESNGLGIAIILLFIIIFISFFLTQIFEKTDPLNAIVMVSNAFTSNGYAVLGSSIPGKLNSIILVWSGYLLGSVGTATLTTGILINHYKNKINRMEKKLDNIEKLIKENNKK